MRVPIEEAIQSLISRINYLEARVINLENQVYQACESMAITMPTEVVTPKPITVEYED